jgi:hypothetical protein
MKVVIVLMAGFVIELRGSGLSAPSPLLGLVLEVISQCHFNTRKRKLACLTPWSLQECHHHYPRSSSQSTEKDFNSTSSRTFPLLQAPLHLSSLPVLPTILLNSERQTSSYTEIFISNMLFSMTEELRKLDMSCFED